MIYLSIFFRVASLVGQRYGCPNTIAPVPVKDMGKIDHCSTIINPQRCAYSLVALYFMTCAYLLGALHLMTCTFRGCTVFRDICILLGCTVFRGMCISLGCTVFHGMCIFLALGALYFMTCAYFLNALYFRTCHDRLPIVTYEKLWPELSSMRKGNTQDYDTEFKSFKTYVPDIYYTQNFRTWASWHNNSIVC